MKRTIGQAVLALALSSQALPAVAQNALASAANDVAIRFLIALDYGDFGTTGFLVGPYANAQQVTGLMMQRRAVPLGSYWGPGRVWVSTQQVAYNAFMVSFRTVYQGGTRNQFVVVECVQACFVKSFNETPG